MNVRHVTPNDQTLRWTMRLIGLSLAIGSAFFLVRNLGLGIHDDLFFGLSATLGILTFGASLWPLPRKTSAPSMPEPTARALPPHRKHPDHTPAETI